MSFDAGSELKYSQFIVLGRTFTRMVVDDCTIWFPHFFGLFNRFIWKFERRTFFFFFASALEMASQCPVVGQLNQRFLKMASLTSIITKFTWYIVFPDKFYLFLDLRKYIPSFTIRLFFKIQRILEFFVWEWFDSVRYENYLQPFHYENVGKVP